LMINSAVWAGALALFLRSGRSHRGAALVLCGTAVVHLYSAALYYLTEILGGMPSVDTQSFVGTYIKFGLANLPWLVGPFFVFRATASWLAAPAPALAAS
jgi:phosphate/sulfate permease